jgi:hypothetical protein
VNPKDRKHTHFRTAKSETLTRWKSLLWGQLTSFHHIKGFEIGTSEVPRERTHREFGVSKPEIMKQQGPSISRGCVERI